jgi:hypothetical protein
VLTELCSGLGLRPGDPGSDLEGNHDHQPATRTPTSVHTDPTAALSRRLSGTRCGASYRARHSPDSRATADSGPSSSAGVRLLDVRSTTRAATQLRTHHGSATGRSSFPKAELTSPADWARRAADRATLSALQASDGGEASGAARAVRRVDSLRLSLQRLRGLPGNVPERGESLLAAALAVGLARRDHTPLIDPGPEGDPGRR